MSFLNNNNNNTSTKQSIDASQQFQQPPNVPLGDNGSSSSITSRVVIESFKIMDLLIQFFLMKDYQSIDNFLNSGISINTQNEKGLTLLQLAVAAQNLPYIKYLLLKGANVNMPDSEEVTPLHKAVSIGSMDIVQVLVSCGAHVNAVDEEGDTPCHYAVREKQQQILQYLLSNGADVNCVNDDGESLLHLSSCFGDLEASKILLSFGANVSIPDNEGVTPIVQAKDNNYSQLFDLLSQYNQPQQQQQQVNENSFPFREYRDIAFGERVAAPITVPNYYL